MHANSGLCGTARAPLFRPDIMLREILPNILLAGMLVVPPSAGMSSIMEASLSFLGSACSRRRVWGSMVSDGRESWPTPWWVGTFPGLAILLVVWRSIFQARAA